MPKMVNPRTGMVTIDAFKEGKINSITRKYEPPELMERIFSISHEIIANPSFDDILDTIVQAVKDLVGCEKAGILLSDETASRLSFAAVADQNSRILGITVPIDASIAGAAFTSDSPLIVQDVHSDPRYFSKVDEQVGSTAQSILAVPLTFREHKIGVIEAINKTQGQFDEADIEMLVVLAAQATITIEIARFYGQAQAEIAQRVLAEEALRRHQEHLEELVKERTAEVQRLATTDSLTGLFTRGHLMTLGDQARKAACRDQQPFSVIMLDVDHFKKINETHGHAVGDDVLKKLAGIFRLHLRSTDLAGRYDGEEFVALMPDTDLQAACELAEHLLNQIRGAQVETAQGQIGFTASIGVVEMDPDRLQTLDSLIDLADQAMCAAKQAGRNQVFVGNLLAEVQRLSLTDSLTGLHNRGYWMLLGNQALQEAQRAHQPFSAMMIDGDHYKAINDTYGHAVGDEVSRTLADILRRHVRSTDIIGRYGGGDEFVVLMPNTSLPAARKLAGRLCDQIRELRVDQVQGSTGLTASIGVAEMDPDHPKTLADLIDKADKAQLAAKRAGGDQVIGG